MSNLVNHGAQAIQNVQSSLSISNKRPKISPEPTFLNNDERFPPLPKK